MNPYLLRDLELLELWTPELRDEILRNRGSIQTIEKIPECIRDRYKTIWEISQKDVIDKARVRQAFCDQSMSTNCAIAKPSFNVLTSMHMYGWEQGLKTGCYYLRSQCVSQQAPFTLEPEHCQSCG